MHSGEKFLEPGVAGPVYRPVTSITLASTFYMMTDFAIYIMPMPTHLAFTYDQEAEVGAFSRVSNWSLVSFPVSCPDTLNSLMTGIARISFTVKLDVMDLSFSNIDPAIWNMVESQVGFVAANVPSLGLFFGTITEKFKMLHNSYLSQNMKHQSLGGSIAQIVPQRITNRGFERVVDDREVGVEATAQPGSPIEDDGTMEGFPMNEIVVKTSLEQRIQDMPSGERGWPRPKKLRVTVSGKKSRESLHSMITYMLKQE